MAQPLAAREYAVIEEDTLIERLRQGNQAAFERLFLRHYPQVFRVLYHLVGSREEAEDLAQETLLALYDQPPATGTGAALVAWLCRVALLFSALPMRRGYVRRSQRILIHFSPFSLRIILLKNHALNPPVLAAVPILSVRYGNTGQY